MPDFKTRQAYRSSSEFVKKPIVDHIQESSRFLRHVGYQNVEMISSIASYLCGLQYHTSAQKPMEQTTYLCFSEKDNSHDPNAMGIYDRLGRIAFMPKDVATYIKTTFAEYQSDSTLIVVVCYVTGRATEKSAQCIYEIFSVSR